MVKKGKTPEDYQMLENWITKQIDLNSISSADEFKSSLHTLYLKEKQRLKNDGQTLTILRGLEEYRRKEAYTSTKSSLKDIIEAIEAHTELVDDLTLIDKKVERLEIEKFGKERTLRRQASRKKALQQYGYKINQLSIEQLNKLGFTKNQIIRIKRGVQ